MKAKRTSHEEVASGSKSSWYGRIVDELDKQKCKAVHPIHFHVEKGEDGGWRVFDRDRQLAFFGNSYLDIWAFSPEEPDMMANGENKSKVIDLHTVHNSYLNFGHQGWPKSWAGQKLKWSWLRDEGEKLEALVRLDAPEEEFCEWRVNVCFDPARGSYRYGFVIDARKMDPEGFEGINLMMAGALEDRPERRRWTHSIWENSDGELRRVVHSNALFQCTDFGGFRDGTGPWRWKHLSYPRSFVGYAAHPVFNPAFLIHRANIPVLNATCSQLFDEHILWNRAGQDNLGEDGYFHFHMETEFVNIPPKLAMEILEKAKDPVRPAKWHRQIVALPFQIGVVNTFIEAVDPWKAEECPILEIRDDPPGRYEWSSMGRGPEARSIRLATDRREHVTLFPTGAVCRVKSHTKYRFSGWIKTEDVSRFARLELASFEYGYGNVIDSSNSEGVIGTSDWIKVAAVLDSGDEAYLMPRMVLYGSGSAWFTELLMEELAG